MSGKGKPCPAKGTYTVGGSAGNRGMGRKKGVPNKATKELKDMILGALSQAGGEDYLLEQSAANPVAFMGLLGKILPSSLTVTGDLRIESLASRLEQAAKRGRE